MTSDTQTGQPRRPPRIARLLLYAFAFGLALFLATGFIQVVLYGRSGLTPAEGQEYYGAGIVSHLLIGLLSVVAVKVTDVGGSAREILRALAIASVGMAGLCSFAYCVSVFLKDIRV